MRAQSGLQRKAATISMEDHGVFSKVTGGCSLPQMWVEQHLARRNPAKVGTARMSLAPQHSCARGDPAWSLAFGPWGLRPGGKIRKDCMIRSWSKCKLFSALRSK